MRGAGLLARIWTNHRVRTVSAAEGYARWAPLYPAHAHNPLMAAESAIVSPLLRSVAPRRALDVGSGTGRNVSTLLQSGTAVVVGMDLSPDMLSRNTAGAPLVRADATCLPFRSRSFDLVSSSLMCGDLPELRSWLGEAARVLVSDGHLVYSDFHPSWRAAGWRRTFNGTDGTIYELPINHHSIDDHIAALDCCGLEVRAIREPKVPGGRVPVVVVFHAVRAPRSPR
jgi:malonyl-CoA O-methyltransferase